MQFRHSSPVSIGSQLDRLSVLGSIGRSDSDLHYSDAHGRSANPSNSDSAARTPTVKHKLWTRGFIGLDSDWPDMAIGLGRSSNQLNSNSNTASRLRNTRWRVLAHG